MQRAMEETRRRRELQEEHNEKHGIVPVSVQKSVEQVRFITRVADARIEREGEEGADRKRRGAVKEAGAGYDTKNLAALVEQLEKEMRDAAAALDFETAARLRDEVFEIRAKMSGDAPRRRKSLAADLGA
jgi:excinuclease ABC subunit B